MEKGRLARCRQMVGKVVKWSSLLLRRTKKRKEEVEGKVQGLSYSSLDTSLPLLLDTPLTTSDTSTSPTSSHTYSFCSSSPSSSALHLYSPVPPTPPRPFSPVPSSLLSLPVIPFWRTSREILEERMEEGRRREKGRWGRMLEEEEHHLYMDLSLCSSF